MYKHKQISFVDRKGKSNTNTCWYMASTPKKIAVYTE